MGVGVVVALVGSPFWGAVQGHVVCLRWRASLPHPVECSTFAAAGLYFQVRNGDWVFPQRYDHRKSVYQHRWVGSELYRVVCISLRFFVRHTRMGL